MTNEVCIFVAKVTTEGMSFRCSTQILQSPRPAVNQGSLATKRSFEAFTSRTLMLSCRGQRYHSHRCSTSYPSAFPLHALAARHYRSPSMLTADAYAVHPEFAAARTRAADTRQRTDNGHRRFYTLAQQCRQGAASTQLSRRRDQALPRWLHGFSTLHYRRHSHAGHCPHRLECPVSPRFTVW